MDFGNAFRRAFRIGWNNKYLILLGTLVIMGTGAIPSQIVNAYTNAGNPYTNFIIPQQYRDLFNLPFSTVVIAAGIAGVLTIPLWVLGIVARGALIHAAAAGEDSNLPLRDAWQPARQRMRTLLGIAVLPALVGVLAGSLNMGFSLVSREAMDQVFAVQEFSFNMMLNPTQPPTEEELLEQIDTMGEMMRWQAYFSLMLCLFIPLWIASIVLNVLMLFAERAAMLEDTSVRESYRRGWAMIKANFANVLVAGILLVALLAVVGLLISLPGLILIFCVPLWPLQWLISGTLNVFTSSSWTIFWQQWAANPAPEIAEAA